MSERRLAGGGVRYAIRFRANGERVYETLGTDREGWTRERADEALQDRLAAVRLGSYVPSRPRDAQGDHAAEPTFHEFASAWLAGAAPELRESTVEVYRWPDFGDLPKPGTPAFDAEGVSYALVNVAGPRARFLLRQPAAWAAGHVEAFEIEAGLQARAAAKPDKGRRGGFGFGANE